MAKYKKDSANYIRAKELYKDSLDANKFTNYLLGTNKKITALTEAF